MWDTNGFQFVPLASTLQRHEQRAERDQYNSEPIEQGQLLPKQECAKNRDQDDAELIDWGDL